MNKMKDFLTQIEKKPLLRKKTAACRSFDELHDLAGAEGYSFSETEFKEAFALDEDALSSISGGSAGAASDEIVETKLDSGIKDWTSSAQGIVMRIS